MDKRYATFVIHRRFMERWPEKVIKLMEKMLVLRAEHLYCRDGIEYVVWHKYFPLVRPGEQTPELIVEVRYDSDGEPLVAYFMKDSQTIIHSKGLC